MQLVHIDVTWHDCIIYRMSFVIRCGTPDCDWGKKMCDLGEDQLRLWSGKVVARKRASNDADVSTTSPIIPYGEFSPVRLEGWPFR